MITSRAFTIDDFMAVRRFLIDTRAVLDPPALNWGVDRWEVLRYASHGLQELSGERTWPEHVHLWEDGVGALVGVAHLEYENDVFLEVHPEHRGLEAEMLAWAEEHHRARGVESISTFTLAADTRRQALLTERGWENRGADGTTRIRDLTGELPPVVLPDGYTVRSIDLTDDGDAAGRAAVGNASFGHDRGTPERVRVLLQAPTYRPDLHLAAIAPDGTFAAYTMVWWEEGNREITFEPVGTHPDHRRLGLAGAVITEGMRRGRDLGAVVAYVGAEIDSPGEKTYISLGFDRSDPDEKWDKTL